MLLRLWQYLDKTAWPARIVSWFTTRRLRARLGRYLLPSSSATTVVTLSVASPHLPPKDLIANALPQGFGSWRDYKVRATLVHGSIAVAILEEPRSKEKFSLMLPVHEDFSVRVFTSLRKVRITCEAERSSLLTLRHADGRLIAAGTLELVPRAAFSQEVLK
jgi:hypothetical protein